MNLEYSKRTTTIDKLFLCAYPQSHQNGVFIIKSVVIFDAWFTVEWSDLCIKLFLSLALSIAKSENCFVLNSSNMYKRPIARSNRIIWAVAFYALISAIFGEENWSFLVNHQLCIFFGTNFTEFSFYFRAIVLDIWTESLNGKIKMSPPQLEELRRKHQDLCTKVSNL